MWTTLLLACSMDDPSRDTGIDPLDGEATELTPSWTAEEAITQLQRALDDGLPQPAVARDSFLGLIDEGQDEVCPGTTDFDGANPLGCTSEAGYHYAGISEYREDPNGWSLGGDFEIREPDGGAFHGAGYVFVHGNTHGLMTEFSGTWSHSGGLDWLDQGRSGVFSATTGGGHTELLGGLDLGGTFVHFDEVVIEELPNRRVGGTVGVRDAVGAWWWLQLEDDGCGALHFGLKDHGRGCLDLARPIEEWVEGLLQ